MTDIVKINPEYLEVAQVYLQTMDSSQTASLLGLPLHEVTSILAERSVKGFINQVFLEQGYNNRYKISSTMDSIIEAKLEEMQEAELTSSKDVAELLAMKHKMRMDEMKLEIELEKARSAGTQVNIQNNGDTNMFGENYGKLLGKLLESKE